MSAAPAKVLVATTSPVTPWAIMRGQLRYIQSAGFDTVLVSAPGDLLAATAEREGVRTRAVPMRREIDPRGDVRALRAMVAVYRQERPDLSVVGTPKAGLIAGLAAWLTRTPTRLYVLRGLRLETARGVRRALLWVLEWLALHLAHEVVVVSPSLLGRTRQLRLLGGNRGLVLGAGASNGVDIARFEATPERRAAARETRRRLEVPSSAFVFGFVGRPTVDKGVGELATAFVRLASARPDVWLVIVGGEDETDLPEPVAETLRGHPRVVVTGWLPDSSATYHLFDALVLPTYREGFPNVSLEAAAAGKPVITTRATGAVDSIADGVTGMLVEPRDAAGLENAMRCLASDPVRAREMGTDGRRFVSEHFTNERVWSNLVAFLDRCAGSRPC